MEFAKTKEDISISYISALCAYSGISYEIIRHDDNSTDGMLMKRFNFDTGMRFDAQLRIQLKCTSSTSQYKDNGKEITYKLKVKNYNDLCTKATTPIILELLVLPEDDKQWINWSKDELLMKGCMYWAEFSEKADSSNVGTVSVKLNKNNVINSNTLLKMLEKIAKEEWP
jgi:hypothetical protein